MFTTFVGVSADRQQLDKAPSTIKTAPTSSSSSTSSPGPARPKRSQVPRACDWCRVHRIKCDSSSPCRNCQNRGGQCSRNTSNEMRTLPQALKEIERLRGQVKELEDQLGRPADSVVAPKQGGNNTPPKRVWEGIHTSSAQWYGPSSSFYFIGRMNAYLAAALEQPQSDDHIQPNSAIRTFTSPTSPRNDSGEQCVPLADASLDGNYLTGTQEDYFLGLFWESYHSTLQIIDKAQFQDHYKSLWVDNPSSRGSSALVDIVLALCMQYGVALDPQSDVPIACAGNVDSNDASIAGRWYYRRCQTLLTSELESPSISTLQCHIFSVIYLCNASFQNMAHTTLAVAVRTAHILGLHLGPPEDMPRAERELRKRVWWTLWTIECKTCMKLGRPWTVPDETSACQLPVDDPELALLSGCNIASYGNNVTWLTYSLLNTKLVLAAQAAYLALYDKCSEVLGVNAGKSLYTDPQSLEACAEFLESHVDSLHTWLESVPDTMKIKRKDGGKPFSTDQTALDVERYSPLWLQRQRLLLELLYHNLTMNIYRPFICFQSPNPAGSVPSPANSTQAPERHAVSCLNHALAITHILRQVLTSTNILNGWYEAFQWQWNASLSIVGFILAYPGHPSTPFARGAIDSAITVFEKFGNNFAVAASAANVTRDLTMKADFLITRFHTGSATSVPVLPDNLSGLLPDDGNDNPGGLMMGQMDDGATTAMYPNTLAGAMGLSYNGESLYSFEPLYAGSRNLADAWVFSQDGPLH